MVILRLFVNRLLHLCFLLVLALPELELLILGRLYRHLSRHENRLQHKDRFLNNAAALGALSRYFVELAFGDDAGVEALVEGDAFVFAREVVHRQGSRVQEGVLADGVVRGRLVAEYLGLAAITAMFSADSLLLTGQVAFPNNVFSVLGKWIYLISTLHRLSLLRLTRLQMCSHVRVGCRHLTDTLLDLAAPPLPGELPRCLGIGTCLHLDLGTAPRTDHREALLGWRGLPLRILLLRFVLEANAVDRRLVEYVSLREQTVFIRETGTGGSGGQRSLLAVVLG